MPHPAEFQTLVEQALSQRRNPTFEKVAGNRELRRVEMQRVLDAQPHLVLEKQYPQLRETLQHFGLIDAAGQPLHGGRRVPDLATVREAFSEDQLKLAVSPMFRCPTLLLVPQTHFSHLIRAMNAHRLPGQNIARLQAVFQEVDDDPSIRGWTPVIAEGAKGAQMESTAKESLIPFILRVRREREEVSPLLRGMDRHTYAMLMMVSMRNAERVSQLIDRMTTTILDEDPSLVTHRQKFRSVPIGKYFRLRNQVLFALYNAQGIGEDFPPGGHWMRSAVAGENIVS